MAYGLSAQAWDARRTPGDMITLKMGVEKLWKGSLLMINAAGYVVMMTDTATGDMFAGVAAETRDNRYKVENDADSGAAAAGDKEINVWVSGTFVFKHAGANQTDVGLPAFWSGAVVDAQQTIESATTAATHDFMVGQITKLESATRVRIRIDGYAMCGSPAASVNGGYST